MAELSERVETVRVLEHAQPELLYGWIARPSLFGGIASSFDFLAVRRLWSWRRFSEAADGTALSIDYAHAAKDLRNAYYHSLREYGVDPHREAVEGPREGQFSFFSESEFRRKT